MVAFTTIANLGTSQSYLILLFCTLSYNIASVWAFPNCKSTLLKNVEFTTFFNLWISHKLYTWPLSTILSPTYLILNSNSSGNNCLHGDGDGDIINDLIHLLQIEGKSVPVITGLLTRDVLRKLPHSIQSLTIIATIFSSKYVTQLIENFEKYTNKRRDSFLFISTSDLLQKHLYSNKVISDLRHKMAYALDSKSVYFDPSTYNKGIPASLPFHQFINHQTLSPPQNRMAFNLAGRHFKMAGCVDAPPYHIIRSRSPLIQDGTHYNIFVASSQVFNFTFETHFKEGEGYAALLENGSWVGMISNLIYTDRNFDFTVQLAHLYDFDDVFDYSSLTIDFLRLTFFQGFPSNEIVAWDSVFTPFTLPVWLSTLIIYLLVSLAILVIRNYFEVRLPKSNAFQSFFIPFIISMEQSFVSSGKIRRIVLFWILLTFATGNAYRTVMISFLTFPSFPELPKTFAELGARLDYNVMLHVLGSVETQFFQHTTNPIFQALNSRFDFVSNEQVRKCYFGASNQEKTACVTWFPVSQLLMTQMGVVHDDNLEQEPVLISKESAMYLSMTIPFAKNSIFVDSFEPIIGAVLDCGLHSKWKEDIFMWFKMSGLREVRKKSRHVEENEEVEKDVAKLKNLAVVFLIWGVGLAIAVLMFVDEVKNKLVATVKKAIIFRKANKWGNEESILALELKNKTRIFEKKINIH